MAAGRNEQSTSGKSSGQSSGRGPGGKGRARAPGTASSNKGAAEPGGKMPAGGMGAGASGAMQGGTINAGPARMPGGETRPESGMMPTEGMRLAGPGGPSQPGPPDAPPPLPTRRSCGTMDVHRRLLSQSPAYAAARSAIENMTVAFAELGAPLRTGPVRIPVVVHVVWNTPQQNISDEQIESQIEVLNRDFRALNTDVGQVPAVWQGLVADFQIEFFLATQDPNGNPTNGITRTQTTRTSFVDDDSVKSTATGGADPWRTDCYLNLWVCQLGGGLLGYAQFPGGPAATDGVVVTHTGFGTTGTASPPFHLGRTTTHEIGHWLNLFHIWGDDGTGCSGSDQCGDTPNAAGPNFGCPAFPHATCGNGPNGDMFMNYMDYVDDGCMVMFTPGQAARAEACLAGPRRSFLESCITSTPRAAGPVVTWSENRLDVFVIGTDRALYHKWWDGTAWGPSVTDYEYLGGVCASAPEVVAWGSNRLDVFVLGTDSALYHKWWDGTAWGPSPTGWESLGGVCASPPRVAAWGSDRLDVFVLGTDRALYHKWWDGTAWGPSVTDWESLGGVCMSAPEAVAWGPNRLDLFVLGTDSALYHKWWDGVAWGPSVTGWESLGGVCMSPPEVVAWGPNRLDVFVLGTDSALYHKWWDGVAWGPSVTDWEYLGGVCTSPPQAVAWGSNRLDVFVLGTDSALYHKWWDGAAWGPSVTDYEYMGGICTRPPQLVAWGPNRLDVFVIGTDRALYHKWWDGAAWGPSVTDYEYMGGVIADF